MLNDIRAVPIVHPVSFPLGELVFFLDGQEVPLQGGFKVRINTQTSEVIIERPIHKPGEPENFVADLRPHWKGQDGYVTPLASFNATTIGVGGVWAADFVESFAYDFAKKYGLNTDRGDWSRSDEEIIYVLQDKPKGSPYPF